MVRKNLPKRSNPRILVITPEITYLPKGMGNMSNNMHAKAGGLADVSSSLVAELFSQGADVHVTLPHYRQMFHIDVGKFISKELRHYMSNLSNDRIHLAEDRIFYYRNEVYSNYNTDSFKLALAFQREVINTIIPKVKPDLIHCNDWMTGLIPAMARRLGIPSLFTVHNIHTQKLGLEFIEDRGIDAAEFWEYLYYENPPSSYEDTRANNKVDLLASGVFSAHYINTVSPTFLEEIASGIHSFIPKYFQNEVRGKKEAGCAVGILNAPDPTYNPENDICVPYHFNSENHFEQKKKNKKKFQKKLGLNVDPNAPLFFWPSRLDPVQKGCQILAETLYKTVSDYWGDNLQVAFVANGASKSTFHDIVRHHDLAKRIAVCDFDEELSHLGYAASDFMLMPSSFEPCGLPQMTSPMYGSLPIVYDTGGLHDTISHLHVNKSKGNGFVFKYHNSAGLKWAIDQAMDFFQLDDIVKCSQISRIMNESKATFNHKETAKKYIEIYESMLQRPLIQ